MPDPPQQTHPHPRLALLCAVIAPVALITGWTWAAAAQPGNFDEANSTISALAALDTPHRWIMTTALVITGVGHVLTALTLTVARTQGRVFLAAGGVATLAVAAFPLPSRGQSSLAHTVAAVAAFLLLALWPAFATRQGTGKLLRPLATRTAATVLTLAAVATFGWVATDSAGLGTVERLTAAAEAIWPLLVALSAWYAAGRPVGSPRVRHGLAALGLVAASFTGGIVATNIAPTTVHTEHYEATVRLALNPGAMSTIHTQTLFGDIDLHFNGLAPGIDAQPAVRDSITEVFTSPGVTIEALQPTPQELDEAVREAAVGVGVRFLAGALAGCVAVYITYAAWTRSRVTHHHLWSALGITTAVIVATGAATAYTYQPDRMRAFTAGGVLGTIQQNADILENVETRASQTVPYVKNLLALSSALQQKYAPADIGGATSAKILLVSDIHGANLYPMMREIVRAEDIDAVVDSGDIVNFGTVQEAQAADIFEGIESLGVPYLYVAGNHDSHGPNDTALLERLNEVPNVTVLDPAGDTYVQASVNGIRIAGFNDPRWFGDDNINNAAKQEPAREAFVRSYAGRERLPDVVVSHEPYAVEGIDFGSIRVNGHIHSPDLEGNRIGVGTFTGGGPMSHFIVGAEGEELRGQPSAFDVVEFGIDCSVKSLARYQFHDVIEGYPAFDDISLINGSTFAHEPPVAEGEERECSHELGFETTVVPEVPQGSTQGARTS